MNRRYRAIIALLIAVPLFAAPLVSPVPDYGPHLEVHVDDQPVQFSTDEEKENQLRNVTTMHYQNLSTPAQRFLDRGFNNESNEFVVQFDEVPEPWTTLVPEGTNSETIYIHKDGQYYYIQLFRFTPKPSLMAFMLRLGPLLGAIGLGTLAGYFVLTAED